MFLLYNIINHRQSFLGYLLLIKRKFWGKTCAKVNIIILSQLKATVVEIKKTGKYIDPNILTFKQQIQIVVSKSSHFFVKCANQATYIKILMLNKEMSVL